jgi:hypothetical protein
MIKRSLAAALMGAAAPAFAANVVLDFSGVTSFASIGQYYSGASGVPGTALGVVFGGDALGLQNDFTTFFSNAPSPGAMVPVGPDSAMNVPGGFVGEFGFHYAASAAVRDGVQLWSGLGGSGSLLASFDLQANAQQGCGDSPYCRFDRLFGTFAGVAYSATFANAALTTAFDDIAFRVPEPGTALLLALGAFGVVVGQRRGRRRGARR